MFERARPRGQLSARELRDAGQTVGESRAGLATGGGAYPVTGPGGTAWADDGADLFTAEVTAVVTVSLLSPRQYGFREVWQNPATGAAEAKTSGRKSDGTANYGLALTGQEFNEGDTVLARRHPRNPHLYLILGLLVAGSSSGSASFVVHRNPRCEDGVLVYDEVTVTLHGNVWIEES